MAKKKKKRPNTPKAKRMNREGRLQSAVSWLKEYSGSHYIRGYRKHFGVDTGTAIAELRQLGVPLSEESVRSAQASAQAAVREKQVRKEKRLQRLQEARRVSWSDETYAYIAGFTTWGFPYGKTREENERFADLESLDSTVPPRNFECFVTFADELNWPRVEERDEEEVPFDLEEFMRYDEDIY